MRHAVQHPAPPISESASPEPTRVASISNPPSTSTEAATIISTPGIAPSATPRPPPTVSAAMNSAGACQA
jgi:hypothetical protein